jgi:hypothetical protein
MAIRILSGGKQRTNEREASILSLREKKVGGHL